MPTYQYQCTDCGHFFEIVQKFTDDSLTVCPECEGRLRKVFNAVGVVFKGSGFYRTDSREAEKSAKASGSAPSSNGTSSPKESSAPAAGSASTSSSSKPSGSSTPSSSTT